MNPCGQCKVLRLSIRLLRTPKGGLRPPSGIPDYDLEYSVKMYNTINV